MRTTYHAELSALSAQVGEMCGLAADAMEHATQALLGADLSVAEQVIADHEHIAAMSKRTEASAIKLLATAATGRQRPEDDPEHDPRRRRRRANGCAGRARRQHLAAATSRMRTTRRCSCQLLRKWVPGQSNWLGQRRKCDVTRS